MLEIAAISTLIFILFPTFLWLKKRRFDYVLVIVFGDIERSPRMRYHCKSLVERGFHVDLIAYKGRSDTPVINPSNPCIIPLLQPPKLEYKNKFIYIIMGLLRVLKQFFRVVFIVLFSPSKPKFILIQNPPAIPTLLLAQTLSFLLYTPLIIDWHNFGYSIMALEHSPRHWIPQVAKWYEKVLGSRAYAHLTVTRAMGDELKSWPVKGKIVTLYDKPPEQFKPMSLAEKAEMLSRLKMVNQDIQVVQHPQPETLFTKSSKKQINLKSDRPALLISSTSWTADEDFSILLDALLEYNSAKSKNKSLPNLVCIITGKGPLKKHYMDLIAKENMEHVSIYTAWLQESDYPKLLSCATIGVSLHTSSSGLDLPMKIVDLFGYIIRKGHTYINNSCGIPVLALNFSCIGELVENGKNGYCFSTHQELSHQLELLLQGYPESNKSLSGLEKGVGEFRNDGWEKNWDQVMGPLIGF